MLLWLMNMGMAGGDGGITPVGVAPISLHIMRNSRGMGGSQQPFAPIMRWFFGRRVLSG